MGKWQHMRSWRGLALAIGLAGVAVAVMAQRTPLPAVAATTAAPRAAPVVAIMVKPGTTLEQAVTEVQKKTHGKVLRAGTREYGNATEYRVKVLMPDGHIRVIPVRARPAHHPSKPKVNSKETH